MAAEWKSDNLNLKRHHRKRTTKDTGCFEDILENCDHPRRMLSGTMSQGEYYLRSLAPLTSYRRKYKARKIKLEEGASPGEKYPPAIYHVDDKLVVTITDTDEDDIITCYHEHFGHPHTRPTHPGECLFRYDEYLKNGRNSNMISDFKELHRR